MAQYDALRDSFESFNRMLIDSQQWNEKHAERIIERDYQHSVLKSNLVQRQFENDMAQQRFALSVKGEDRLAAAAAEDMITQKFNRKMRLETAGRDKRQLAIAENKNNMDMEEHSAKMADIKRMTDPVDVDLSTVIPDYLKDPKSPVYNQFMTELNELTGRTMGAFVDVDMLPKVTDMQTGESIVVQRSLLDQQDMAIGLQGLITKFTDPNENAKFLIQHIETGKQDLQKIISKDSTLPADKAFAKREINRLNAQQKKYFSVFKPENTRDYLLAQSKQMLQSAAYLRKRGLSDVADSWDAQAKVYAEKALAAHDKSQGKTSSLYYSELKDGKPVYYAEGTMDTLDMEWTIAIPGTKDGELYKSTQLPPGVQRGAPTAADSSADARATAQEKAANAAYKWASESMRKSFSPTSDVMDTFPDQKAGIDYSERLMAKMADIEVKNEQGVVVETLSPKNNKEATRLRDLVQIQFRKNHNDAHQDYLVAQKSRNPKRLEEWRQDVLNEFGYLPTKPFVDQIWMGTSKIRK